jgi:hypothetical protein
MAPLDLAFSLSSSFGIDFIRDLSWSDGYDQLYVIIVYFTNKVNSILCKKKETNVENLALGFVHKI